MGGREKSEESPVKIRLGISACLLGECVRYDSGHRLDRQLIDRLEPFVEFVPVCPEVECGLPTPREPMRLEGDSASPRLVTIATCTDHTELMEKYALDRVRGLEGENLRGFVFKSGSPSCGVGGVEVFREGDGPAGVGEGIFVRIFTGYLPHLPVEDEECLRDPRVLEDFIERIT